MKIFINNDNKNNMEEYPYKLSNDRGIEIYLTKEENKILDKIYRKYGVANPDHLENFIIKEFVSNNIFNDIEEKGLEVLENINKEVEENLKTEKFKNIYIVNHTSNNAGIDYYTINDEDFLHHSINEALYWTSLKELILKSFGFKI